MPPNSKSIANSNNTLSSIKKILKQKVCSGKEKMKPFKGYFRRITTALEKTIEVQDRVKPFESMPGPKPLPLIGNLWRYFPVIGNYSLSKLHRTYESMYREYGPVVREKVFGERVLVHVYDPKDMITVYKNEGRLPERCSHRALARYRTERPDVYNCPGLFPSNGEEWYNFRHMFHRILLAGTTGEACSSAIENVTDDLVAKIPSKLNSQKEMDIQPLLFNWALECIGMVTLNRRLGCLSENENKEAASLVEAVNNIHKSVFQTENSPFNYKESYKILEESQDFLASVVEKYIEEALKEIHDEKNKHSVLAKMVAAENVSKKDLFTMVIDMFLAGIDTTAYSLAFMLYNLSKERRVQDKLRKELVEHLPEKHSRITESRCRLRYLQNVIHEGLRLNPVAIGTGRIIPTDLVLGGYHVPAKTMVILQHQVASMLEHHFKDAHVFRPERWEETFNPLVSSPFGYGPRMCIGIRIARKELALAVAKIVRNFSLSYHHDDIDSFNMLINVPDKPVMLRFESTSS